VSAVRFSIRAARADDGDGWAALRAALWPDDRYATMRDEIPAMLSDAQLGAFVAADADGALIGFAECSLRRDYVNGTESSPVGFLEGWFVAPAWRRHGVGRALLQAVEHWTRDHGAAEFASDALLANDSSHSAHRACGFEETERVVYFRKRLA